MPYDSQQLVNLQAIAFDVDGVLTDGTLTWSSASTEEIKTFSFTDIMGISLLRRLGIRMALISGEDSPLVTRYSTKMHIPFVIKGTRDKATALRSFADEMQIDLAQTCFFGDDVNDLAAMQLAGFCACPADAAIDVRTHVAAHGFLATYSGGKGAVRELADAILLARNLRAQDVFYLRPPD